jgi:hypothetical protein
LYTVNTTGVYTAPGKQTYIEFRDLFYGTVVTTDQHQYAEADTDVLPRLPMWLNRRDLPYIYETRELFSIGFNQPRSSSPSVNEPPVDEAFPHTHWCKGRESQGFYNNTQLGSL